MINYHVNSSIRPNIELVQDFMTVLMTCKSDKDSIKNKIAIFRITFSEVSGAYKGG